MLGLRMLTLSRPLQAILFMLAGMFCLSAMNTAIQLLGKQMHSTQIVAIRQVWSIVIVLCWTAWLTRAVPRFPTKRVSGHFWRATFGICAMELWFYSITIMPINVVTALSFTTPIFSTIFAILFLGEKAGLRRWGAIATGFAGMLLILRPDIGGVSTGAMIVILSSALMAVAGIMVKNLTATESPETIVFYMALFMLPWSVLPAAAHWNSIDAQQLGGVFIIALFSTAAHLLMARAFVRAELVVLMPFDFTRLIFTAALAYLFLGETVDAQTLAGAAVIVTSTVYIAHREAKKRGQDTTPASIPA